MGRSRRRLRAPVLVLVFAALSAIAGAIRLSEGDAARAAEAAWLARATSPMRPAWLLATWFGATAAQGRAGEYFDLVGFARNLDANSDGIVDRQEFLDAEIQAGPGKTGKGTPLMVELFKTLDKNGDNKLDAHELSGLEDIAGDALDWASRSMFEVADELPEQVNSNIEVETAVVWVAATSAKVHKVGPMDWDAFRQSALVFLHEHDLFSLLGHLIPWLHAVFDKSDLDHNGVISEDEATFMTYCMTRWLDEGFPLWSLEPVEHKEREEDEDDAGDGEDYDGVMSEAVAGTLEELDTDGDGQISRHEYFIAAEATDPSSQAMDRATRLFTYADLDADGSLDEEELARLLALAYRWAG